MKMKCFIRARKKAGMKACEVAQMLGIGKSTVSMWENGHSLPRTKTLKKLLELYDCKMEDLFNSDEQG